MIWKYQLPDNGMLPLMVKWADESPTSSEEKLRNNKIVTIMHNYSKSKRSL